MSCGIVCCPQVTGSELRVAASSIVNLCLLACLPRFAAQDKQERQRVEAKLALGNYLSTLRQAISKVETWVFCCFSLWVLVAIHGSMSQ